MIQLYTLLIIAETTDPGIFLAIWGGGCLLAVYGSVGGWVALQNYVAGKLPTTVPTPVVRKRRARHALGDPDRSQAGIPAALLLAEIRAARTDIIASHKAGV